MNAYDVTQYLHNWSAIPDQIKREMVEYLIAELDIANRTISFQNHQLNDLTRMKL